MIIQREARKKNCQKEANAVIKSVNNWEGTGEPSLLPLESGKWRIPWGVNWFHGIVEEISQQIHIKHC